MDSLKIKNEEYQDHLIPFIRSSTDDWDYIKYQLIKLNPDDTIFLKSWCKKILTFYESSSSLPMLDYEDRLLRLESDKISLNLQVTILSDQIDEQTIKINELEKLLNNKKCLIDLKESKLQDELLHRSTLETQKFELIKEISGLKLKQTILENENFELREKMCGNSSFGGYGISSTASFRIKPPQSQHQPFKGNSYSTMPRIKSIQQPASLSSGNITAIAHYPTNNSNSHTYQLQLKPIMSVGGGGGFIHDTKSTSAPNLAATIDREEKRKKSNTILKIFDKFKRNTEIRNTMTAKYGWMDESIKPQGPINSWTSKEIIQFITYIGLDMYTNEIKRWVKNGEQLVNISLEEIEKEIGIKNPLHRKKLKYNIDNLIKPIENIEFLNHNWILHWLDDIGLPQYKENFSESKVDGLMLNQLTYGDLSLLKINNILHQISIKRAIQLLRINGFNPNCLIRRGGEEGPLNVSRWTMYRVMEWLKSIDLAEYAPNLRGSGIHGGLIILENKFNSEFLSNILSIPGSKTLLRRHLSLQLNDLVGKVIMSEKRKMEMSEGFEPLSINGRVKLPKSSMFNLKRKSEAGDEILCSFELNSFPFDVEVEDLYQQDGNQRNNEKVSNI